MSEDLFLCSICLDVFTDPVSTPCGHNFCKNCITQHWDINDRCQCPMCKESFTTRPDVHVNTFISEMVSQFRHEAEQKRSSSSEQQVVKPGEVPCDICAATKLKALKSCLVCLVSFCETHLEPHLTASGLKRHQLMDPVKNLEDRMCRKHDKPLELFCKTDHTCVCMLCSVLDHETHEFVTLKEESEGKKAELEKTEAEIQQMIQKRRLRIQEIKRLVNFSKEHADGEIVEGVRVFSALMEAGQSGMDELIELIEKKQRKKEKEGESLIEGLEQEISELMERSSEVEKLSKSEDHLLQSLQSLKAAPPTKTWMEISFSPESHRGTVFRAVGQLEEMLSKDMKNLVKAELKKVQHYAAADLMLSYNGKLVHRAGVRQHLPDNTSLCINGFSSGRFYYEVQVKGKTGWTLGVVTESINRKENIPLRPDDGSWTICLTNGDEYKAFAGYDVFLNLKWRPEKVGMFVDYEEGLVSFYDVDAAAVMHRFTDCSFTEKLYSHFECW
ncbi:E3 ubiquitin-protein ligase TRIM39 [Channa argus]|uniref:E3 ubiquitin-protein ligase TRIM39 n=1 Tax=Channa argus TaxID=215402 RepID=A0A6G1PD07_CHAAH|nr:E3 ubiquitin-protein ligase TRIM39 [Channa argus]